MPAHEEVNLHGRAFSAAPAEAGASPRFAVPMRDCESVICHKRGEACLGMMCLRADGGLARRIPLRQDGGGTFVRAPVLRWERRSVFSCLRCARRSACGGLSRLTRVLFRAVAVPHRPVLSTRPVLSVKTGQQRGDDFLCSCSEELISCCLRASTRGVQPLSSSAPEPGMYPCPCRSSRSDGDDGI